MVVSHLRETVVRDRAEQASVEEAKGRSNLALFHGAMDVGDLMVISVSV